MNLVAYTDLLFIFYHVAKNTSMKLAVEELGLSLPTVSQKIKKLEVILEKDLFTRHTSSGLRLTEFGEGIFDIASDLMSKIENVEHRLISEKTRTLKKREIRIITTKGIASIFVVKAVCEFNKVYPNINFIIKTTDDDIVSESFHEDIAISPSVYGNNKDFLKTELYTDNLVLFASREYIQKFGSPKNNKDLNNHTFFKFHLSDKHNRGDSDSLLINEENSKRPFITVNSFLCQFELVKAGKGIATFLTKTNHLMESDLISLDHLGAKEVSCYTMVKRHKLSHLHISQFVDFINEFSGKIF